MPAPPEELVDGAVAWLRRSVETLSAGVVAVGIVNTVWRYLLSVFRRQATSFNSVRLDFARYLALALKFQLGADILSTAIAILPAFCASEKFERGANKGNQAGIANFFPRRRNIAKAENIAISPEEAPTPAATF